MANFCEKCGSRLTPGASFCPECGARTANTPAPVGQPVQTYPVQQPVQNHPVQQPVQQSPAPYQQPVYPQPTQAPVKEPAKKKSPALTVLIIVLAVILAAEGVVAGIWFPGFFTGGNIKTEDHNNESNGIAEKTESATLTADNPSATLCGVTIEADSYNLKDGDLDAVIADNGTGVAEDGAEYREYEIDLGEESEYYAASTLTFPCDGDPDDYEILHQDHETGNWMPMIGFPDEENGTITVYTDSFSKFRAKLKVDSPLFIVANEGKPNATIEISPNYLETLKKLDEKTFKEEVEAFAADPLHYDPVNEGDGEEGSSAMRDFLVNASGPLSEVIGGAAELDFTPVEFVLKDKTYSYAGSAMKSDLSKFVNGVSILNIGLQLTNDIRKHGVNSDTTAANLMKNLATNGGTLYSMATGYTSTAFTFTFFGVAMIGMGLDEMTETAKGEQQKYMTKLMKTYYEKVKPFNEDYWYAEFNRICRDDRKTTQEAINEVSALLDRQAAEFWEVISKQSSKEFEDLFLEAGIKNVYNIPTEKKNQLTAQVKNDFRKKFNELVLPKIEKDIIAKQQAAIYTLLDQFRQPFNRVLNFKVIERVDMQTVFETRYNGCSIAFGKGKNIQTGEGWVLTAPESDDNDWDDGWQEILTATDYAWMCAGLPDTAYVYLSESDMKKGAKPLTKMNFSQPHAAKDRTAVINLSESTTYAYRLKELDINPNYEIGDPEKVTGYEGDIDMLYVYWEETVEENGVKTVKEYEDITAANGAALDYPSDFVFDCYYDSKGEKSTNDRSQDSSAVVRYGDTEKALSKKPYYPTGYNGHRYEGDNIVPDPEEGLNIRIVVNRGVYTLVYQYESVPVDEKDYLDYQIVNNCKNEADIEDYLGTWHYVDGKFSGDITFELSGKNVKVTSVDEKNNSDSFIASYKLENGALKLYVNNNILAASAQITDKDHIKYSDTRIGTQTMTRKK